jgi:hypothetical protein
MKPDRTRGLPDGLTVPVRCVYIMLYYIML